MRALHVTFWIEPLTRSAQWEHDFGRICSAGGIWGILQKADMAGVKLRFTFEIKDQLVRMFGAFNLLLPRQILPPKYESRTTVILADAPP